MGKTSVSIENTKYRINLDNSTIQTTELPSKPTDGLAYKLSVDGTYAICTGFKNDSDKEKENFIIIADTYEGVPVKTIDSGAFISCKLTGIKIPSSVSEIGNTAFHNCRGLTSVLFADSLSNTTVVVGNETFILRDLRNNNLGASLKSIGDAAFYYCSSLKSVEIPTGVTSIGAMAFYYCESLTSVKIPNSVTSISARAFCNCKSLTSVVIPNSVTSIGECAFQYCESLTSMIISDSVTTIGGEAFYSCKNLTGVVIGDSVTSIGDKAFYGCYKLVEVANKSMQITVTKGSSSNGYVGYYASAVYNNGDMFTSRLENNNGYIIYTDSGEKFLVGYNGTKTDLVLPSYITKIYQYAFHGCSSLTSIEIPDSVTSIDKYAFSSCRGLTSVVIGDGIKAIGEYAFGVCSKLMSVVIPNSVTSIGKGAFYDCSGLVSVVIPDSVISIDQDAFKSCNNLTIYCEVSEPPSGWSSSWNTGGRPVVWGYTESA